MTTLTQNHLRLLYTSYTVSTCFNQ